MPIPHMNNSMMQHLAGQFGEMGHVASMMAPNHAPAIMGAFGKHLSAPQHSFGRFAGEKLIDHSLSAMATGLRDIGVLKAQHALAPKPIHALLQNAAVVGGMGVAGAAGNYAMGQMAVQSSFKKMLQLYPELQRENPERVKTYFDSISQGSPDIASNPLVVGSLIKRMLNYDGFDTATYNELVGSQANIDRGRSEGMKNTISLGEKGMSTLHNYGIGSVPRVR
jgi:hypothetical protein